MINYSYSLCFNYCAYCWHKYCAKCCCCSVTKSCLTLCNSMDCSMPGFPVLHCLPQLAQTYVLWVSDTIQPSHPLSLPSPLVLNLSQHQGLFQWVCSLHQVAKVLELLLQHQFFPMNIQGWFLLRLTGLISLLSKGHSRIFSSSTVQRMDAFKLWYWRRLCLWPNRFLI